MALPPSGSRTPATPIPAPVNSVQRYGIRNTSDVINFLANEWLDKRGMGNCLLYGLGIWSNNAAGNYAPSIANITIQSADVITGTTEASISPPEWKSNGDLPATTFRPPTLGNIWIVNEKGSGGEDRFSQRLFTEVPTISAETSTWKSYVDIGAMWVGDTVPRRGVFYTSTAAYTQNTILGRAGLPLPTGLPRIPGSFTDYTETATASPVPRASD